MDKDDIDYIKELFENGDFPVGKDFNELISSTYNQYLTGYVYLSGGDVSGNVTTQDAISANTIFADDWTRARTETITAKSRTLEFEGDSGVRILTFSNGLLIGLSAL